jgi:GAF domain-containing protein
MKKLKAGEQIFLDHLDVERQSQTPAGELYRRLDIHSALLFPIRRHDTLLGMLCVYTPGQRHLFPPEEVAPHATERDSWLCLVAATPQRQIDR